MQWEHLFPQEILTSKTLCKSQRTGNRWQQFSITSDWLGLFWLTSVNGSIIWPTPSDFYIYLKLRELHIWWLLFLKLPNKARANNSTQVPSSSVGEQGCLAAHRLWPCILSHDQNGNVHAQLKGTEFSVGFSFSTTSLTEVQRDQQPDVSASSTNAENSLFLSLCTHS